MPEWRSNTARTPKRDINSNSGEGDLKLTHFSYPFRIDEKGRSEVVDEEEHIRQMIEQILFTAPGERVNRPTFGSGVHQLVFAPNSDELATATQLLIQGALLQWMGDLILVEAVQIRSQESSIHIVVRYRIKRSQELKLIEFDRRL